MRASCPNPVKIAGLLVLGILLTLAPVNVVNAQHTMDPYNIVGEYNNQYQPYFFPTYPKPGTLFPNQDRIQERAGTRSANQFRQYLDGMEEADLGDPEARSSGPRYSSGAGTPYYKANRQYDRQFGRLYRPNREADVDYDRQQKQSSDKYFRAVAEKDPKKRSQLLREYNMEKLRAARQLSGGRNASPLDRAKITDKFADPSLDEPGMELPSDEPTTRGSTTRPVSPLGERPSDRLPKPPGYNSELKPRSVSPVMPRPRREALPGTKPLGAPDLRSPASSSRPRTTERTAADLISPRLPSTETRSVRRPLYGNGLPGSALLPDRGNDTRLRQGVGLQERSSTSEILDRARRAASSPGNLTPPSSVPSP